MVVSDQDGVVEWRVLRAALGVVVQSIGSYQVRRIRVVVYGGTNGWWGVSG